MTDFHDEELFVNYVLSLCVMENVLIICVVLSMLITLFRLFNCCMLLFKLRVVFYAFTYATLQTKNGAIVVSALNYFFLFFLAVSSRRHVYDFFFVPFVWSSFSSRTKAEELIPPIPLVSTTTAKGDSGSNQ